MPPKKAKYKIVKVANESPPPTIRIPTFPPLPRLYLELLENKAKVKPELRDLEWDPKSSTQIPSFNPFLTTFQAEADTEFKECNDETSQSESRPNFVASPMRTSREPYSPPKIEFVKKEDPSPQPSFLSFSRGENRVPEPQPDSRPESPAPEQVKSFSFNKFSSRPSSRESEYNWDSSKRDEPKEERFDDIFSKYESKTANEEPAEDEIPDEMRAILEGKFDEKKPSSSEGYSSSQPVQSYSSHQAQQQPQQPQQSQQSQQPQAKLQYNPQEPPSLKTVMNNPQVANYSQGPNIANLTIKGSMGEEKEKQDLLFKLNLLRKQYKDVHIPEFDQWTDVKTLQNEYERLTRQLKLDSTVENYKKFLTIAFFGLEFLLTNLIKWNDMKGFAQNQLVGMNQYEKLLVEIGEKHYLEPQKQWPPEMKLLGMVFMNAAIFVGTRMLFKGAGGGIMNMFSGGIPSTSSSTANPIPTSAPSKPKPTMKVPDYDIDDLFSSTTTKKNN